MATILLIEVDQHVRASISQALVDAGFHVVTASDSTLGVMVMYETCPDMVLLDEAMPPVNGEELCSYISRIFTIPIVVLVSKEQGLNSARFLQMGADARLAKPPDRRMLLAMVNCLFRRYRTSSKYSLPSGVELDAAEHQASLGESTIDLTPTEFRLLSCLALNSNRLVSYAELAIGGWGKEEISPGELKFYISRLKEKLAYGSDSDFDLLNGRGIGYRFVMQ